MKTIKFIGILSLGSIVFSGCSSSKEVRKTTSSETQKKADSDALQFIRSLAIKGAGKTAVFCLNGDEDTKRRLEAKVVQQMKDQGFDANVGRNAIPTAAKYSANDLAKALRKSAFKSIAEVTYSGQIPKEGFPDNLSFNLHNLPEPRTGVYQTLETSRANALLALFQAAIQYGLSK